MRYIPFIISFLLFALLSPLAFATNIGTCGYLNDTDTYDLTNNVSAGLYVDCFTIKNNSITIDCHGYTINYSTELNPGHAITTYSNNYYNGTTIKNCVIDNTTISFNDGAIHIIGYNTTIENNKINVSATDGIAIYTNGINCTLINNTINMLSTDSDYAIYTLGGYASIYNNTVITLSDQSTGLSISNHANNSVIQGNNLFNRGIETGGLSDNTTIDNNTITSIQTDGIYIMDGGDNIKVTNNNITITTSLSGYVYAGIRSYADYFTIENNTITCSNQFYGIYTSYSKYFNITSNNITTNNSCSINLNTNAYNSTIANNILISQANYSIYVASNSDGSYIYNNIINGSAIPVNLVSTGLNYWNITEQAGTKIYGSGTNIGGNHFTNSTGDGYSDTCPDTDYDEFCDSPYNISTNSACTAGVDCEANATDYLPYQYDVSSPSWSNPLANTTIAGQECNFTMDWTDNTGLSGFIFSTNQSGSWANSSWIAISGTPTSYTTFNATTLNATYGTTFSWRFYVNDTDGNNASSAIQDITTTGYPNWSTNISSTPAMFANTSSLFNISWSAPTGSSATIDTVYIETNCTHDGTARNFTMLNDTYGGAIYNYSFVMPACENAYWKSYANDTNGYWNNSDSWSFTITKSTALATRLNLTFNGTEGNLSKVYVPGSTNVSANYTISDIIGIADIIFSLFQNSTLIGITNPIANDSIYGFGEYLFSYNSSGGQNYTSANKTYLLNITINTTNPIHLVMTKDNWVTNYTDANISALTTDTVNITCVMNFTDGGTATLYVDGSLSSTPYGNTFGAGTHNITCNTTGNANYTANATGANYYVIATAPTITGGGGGGGLTWTSVCGNGICEVGEDIYNCIRDCANISFETNPSVMESFIDSNETVTLTFVIRNLENTSIIVRASIDGIDESRNWAWFGSLGNFTNTSTFNISAKGTMAVPVTIRSPATPLANESYAFSVVLESGIGKRAVLIKLFRGGMTFPLIDWFVTLITFDISPFDREPIDYFPLGVPLVVVPLGWFMLKKRKKKS